LKRERARIERLTSREEKATSRKEKRQLGCQNKKWEQGSRTPNVVLYKDMYTITVTKVKRNLDLWQTFI